MSNIADFLENIRNARYGKDVRGSIISAIEEIDSVADTAQDSATAMAQAAAGSADEAQKSALEAETIAEAAKTSEANAANSAGAAKKSETNAAASAAAAAKKADEAKGYAESAAGGGGGGLTATTLFSGSQQLVGNGDRIACSDTLSGYKFLIITLWAVFRGQDSSGDDVTDKGYFTFVLNENSYSERFNFLTTRMLSEYIAESGKTIYLDTGVRVYISRSYLNFWNVDRSSGHLDSLNLVNVVGLK